MAPGLADEAPVTTVAGSSASWPEPCRPAVTAAEDSRSALLEPEPRRDRSV